MERPDCKNDCGKGCLDDFLMESKFGFVNPLIGNQEGGQLFRKDNICLFEIDKRQQAQARKKMSMDDIGDFGDLVEHLDDNPQRDETGRFKRLLTGGFAVDAVIGGLTRGHRDIDYVVLDGEKPQRGFRLSCDNFSPNTYAGGMNLQPEFLQRTAWTTTIEVGDRRLPVDTVHPAILIVQKLSDCVSMPPRDKDVADVARLIGFWRDVQESDPDWIPVIGEAVATIPEIKRKITIDRLAARGIRLNFE